MSSECRWRACPLAAALLFSAAALAQAGEGGTARCTPQQPWPPRFTLEYTVVARRGALSLEGENELQFRNEAGQYALNSSTRSVLYRARQESRGSVQGRVLKPAEYVEQNQRREATTTTIDWQAEAVRFSAAPDAPGHAVPLLQDRLSILLQLGEQVRHQPDGDVVLPVAGVRSVAEYRFERRGKDSIELPAGTFETVRLLRRDLARNEAIEVWLAPSACWLPVKLRYTDDRGYMVENLLHRAVFD